MGRWKSAPSSDIIEPFFQVASALIEANPFPNLNAIDGGFYWNFVRRDFVQRAVEMRAHLETLPVGLRHSELSKLGYDFELLASFGIPSEFAWGALLDGKMIPYGPVTIRPVAASDLRYNEKLVVTVGSEYIRGSRLVELIQEWLIRSPFDVQKASSEPQTELIEHSVTFNFRANSHGAIVFEIPVPLPSWDYIAVTYDTHLRANPNWSHAFRHRKPVDGNQEPLIAIRTWVIGLLMGAKCTQNWAMNEVQERLRIASPHPSGFRDDRRRLLSRVPEAEPLLRRRNT